MQRPAPKTQRWGASAKGGGKTQRWGRNAKKGGAKTQRTMTGFFDLNKLMQVVAHRGYLTEKAIADAMSPIFGLTSAEIIRKLKKGRLTKEECEVLGSYFEMTMKEYYDTFMCGLFVEDQEGHYVCHVDRPYLHLHPQFAKKTKRVKEDKRNDLLREIDEIEEA